MIVVEAEAVALVIVATRSVLVQEEGVAVIVDTMIEVGDLGAEAQVEGVAEVEALVEGETGAQ